MFQRGNNIVGLGLPVPTWELYAHLNVRARLGLMLRNKKRRPALQSAKPGVLISHVEHNGVTVLSPSFI